MVKPYYITVISPSPISATVNALCLEKVPDRHSVTLIAYVNRSIPDVVISVHVRIRHSVLNSEKLCFKL